MSCAVDQCDGPAYAKGYCNAHYARVRKHGDPQADLPLRRRTPVHRCAVDACDRRSHALGYCSRHYQRLQRYGDAAAGGKLRAPGGTGHLSKDGYVYLFEPGHPNASGRGKLLAHIKVMAETLGRPVRRGETVHHKNGIKHDNRPANLELWRSGHPGGQRVVDRLAWAVDLIEQYAADGSVWTPDLAGRLKEITLQYLGGETR